VFPELVQKMQSETNDTWDIGRDIDRFVSTARCVLNCTENATAGSVRYRIDFLRAAQILVTNNTHKWFCKALLCASLSPTGAEVEKLQHLNSEAERVLVLVRRLTEKVTLLTAAQDILGDPASRPTP
jgi:hypothetical protein